MFVREYFPFIIMLIFFCYQYIHNIQVKNFGEKSDVEDSFQ